jgi:Fe-S-cluster containining protein
MHVLDFCQMYVAEYEEGFSLREMDNGDCCMLAHGKCRIYGVRPMQCRTWPFWASNLSTPQAWQAAKRRCPGMDRGRLWPLAEIDRIRKMVLV